MPGLSLTLPQARRLFGVGDEVCARILDGLVADGKLAQSHGGVCVYRRLQPVP